MGARRFDPPGPLSGTLAAPPDKSISHRAALLAAMSDGETAIERYLDAADTRSTLDAVAALGASVEIGRRSGWRRPVRADLGRRPARPARRGPDRRRATPAP